MLPSWFESKEFWIASSAISALLFVGTLIAIPVVCVRLPVDTFVRPIPKRPPWVVAVRAAAAFVVIAMGVAMLVLPGQGVLTILVGLSLLDFQAKRELQRKLLMRPTVLRAINGMRSKAGKPPLQVS